MNVICKFRCDEVAIQTQGRRVTLNAASGEGNKSWSKWTPSGKLDFFVTNPDVFDAFEPGKEYFITLAEVPVEPPSPAT